MKHNLISGCILRAGISLMYTLFLWHHTVFGLDCYKCIPSPENKLCYHLLRDAQIIACAPDERCFKASGDMVLQDYSKAAFQLSMCITQRQLNTLDAEYGNTDSNTSTNGGKSPKNTINEFLARADAGNVSATLQEQACLSGPQAESLMRYFFRQTEEAYDRPMRAETDFASEVLPGTIHNPTYCQCQSDLCNSASSIRLLFSRSRHRTKQSSMFFIVYTFLFDGSAMIMPLIMLSITTMFFGASR